MIRSHACAVAVAAWLAASSAPVLGAQRPTSRPGIEVTEATIGDLQRAMTEGRATAVQLVDAYLARIGAYDSRGPALNAILRVNPSARADALARDAERKQGAVRGPLHGIPIILKDNFDTKGWATSGGSIALAAHIPDRDSYVVRRLREAGAVILAKSNMHELAAGITTISSLGGQTRNPYDPSRCPGGSSGGTGAAIAASFAAVGWGTDTCGSIRIPASFGSLFGLRPTQGMVSRDGIVPLSLTQDIAGPLARTVTDLAIALDATIGPDPADAATRVLDSRQLPHFVDSLSRDALRGARLGLLLPNFRGADADVADTVRAAARAMKALGAELIDVNIADFDSLMAGSSAILLESKFDLADYLKATPGAPVQTLSDIIAGGLFHAALETRHRNSDTATSRDSESHRKALAKQAVIRTRIIALMDSLRLDALVYPTMLRKPVLVGDPQLGSTCALAAQTGLPALSAPAGFTSDGLPVGIELLGRPFADARLVALAYAFEQSGGGLRRRAPSTTPPLVAGKGPAPLRYVATVGSPTVHARAAFTFDALQNALEYSVTVQGAASRVDAVVLRRPDSAGPGRVIYRLLGPSAANATGRVQLGLVDREALRSGKLLLSLFTSDRPGAPQEASLRRPE